MTNVLRRYQKPLMIGVTLVIIISFTFLSSQTDFANSSAGGKVATIYGRPVTYAQTQKLARRFDLGQELGMDDLVLSLSGRQPDKVRENFVWNSYVLRHEAAQLGIEPTDDEVLTAIQKMPAFQNNGHYDSSRYTMINERLLGPRGFTPGDMEDLVRDDLRMRKIKAVLGSTVAPSETELRNVYAQSSQKTEASVVRLKLDDFVAATQVSDEDVKKSYEERKAGLKTDEKRKVKFAAFILPTTETPLQGKDRAEALAKLQKQAEEFVISMTEKDAKFEDVAAKLGVKVEETPDFARNAPPAELGESREAAMMAFKLTKEQPNADPIGTNRGYYVMQLSSISPAREQTFDEAKQRVADELKRDRATEALNLKAIEIRNKIEAELKAGKSFADAAQAAGAKAEKFPAFSRMDPQMEPENSGEIMSVASELDEKQLSTATPTQTGGSVIVYVEKRLPIDEEKFKADRAKVVESLTGFQKAVLFSEWIKLRRDAAGLQTLYSGT
jgi:peptidyl-prolyl cis-trans isomerase D